MRPGLILLLAHTCCVASVAPRGAHELSPGVSELSVHYAEAVFLKFHEVGSGTIKALFSMLQQEGESPVLKDVTSEHMFTDHTESYRAVEPWMKKGKVPKDVLSCVILRDPGERFLSKFFKSHFDPGIDVGSAATKLVKSKALLRYVPDKKWKNLFKHVAGLERFFNESYNFYTAGASLNLMEYQNRLCHDADRTDKETVPPSKCVAQVKKVLSQFTLVGVSEREEALQKRICAHLQLPSERCTELESSPDRKAKMENNGHRYPPHPTMSDFSDGFQRFLREYFADEYEIYNSVEAQSREADMLVQRRTTK